MCGWLWPWRRRGKPALPLDGNPTGVIVPVRVLVLGAPDVRDEPAPERRAATSLSELGGGRARQLRGVVTVNE